MDMVAAQAASHSSPCHNLETVKLDTAVELTRMKAQLESLEEHRRRLNGHLESLDERTLAALREVQTLPTEVEQRAYQVAADLRGELGTQFRLGLSDLRGEIQRAMAAQQEARQLELTETRAARRKLYAGIASTLALAATAAGPNAWALLTDGLKILLGGTP